MPLPPSIQQQLPQVQQQLPRHQLSSQAMSSQAATPSTVIQQIFSLGHRLKVTDFQIFRDLPTEIINKRKRQMETFKEAKKRGIPTHFSKSQPDKLFVREKP